MGKNKKAAYSKREEEKANRIVKKVLTNEKNHVIIKKNPKKKEEGLTWHKNKHVPNKLQITVLFGTLILYWKILKQALHCREMK